MTGQNELIMYPAAGRLPAISAHRGGGETAPAGTFGAYRSAVTAGAEYVEFDVRRTADGQFVSYHGARTPAGRRVGTVSYQALCDQAGYRVPLANGIMRLLAGRVTGHLDLKDAADTPAIIEQALGILGPGGFVVTTGDATAAAAIKRAFAGVPVALTIGGDLAEQTRFAWQRAHTPGLTRLDRVSGCLADWTAVHHRTARPGLLAECRRLGIRTLVWTVNSDRGLAHWLARPGVDVLVTDRPRYAAMLRDRLAAGSPPAP